MAMQIKIGPVELTLPEQWPPCPNVTIAGPVLEGYQHTVVISSEAAAPAIDLLAHVRSRMEILATAVPSFRLESLDPSSVAGCPSVSSVICWELPGGTPIRQTQVHVLLQNLVYTMTFSALESTAREFEPAIEAISKSLKLSMQ